jgi:hypothetical protein
LLAWVLVAALGVGSTASCSGSDGSGACTVTRPSACRSPGPSWSKQVQPIIDQACAPCHFPGPGGQALSQGNYDFSSYRDVDNNLTLVLQEVSTCTMPLAGGNAPLSTADAETIVNWILCGGANN